MLTPKSQVLSCQSTARKVKGSSAQSISDNDFVQKLGAESPKVEKIIKVSQKLLSPNQKGDLTLTNRISSQRSRREKSESIPITALHSRTASYANHSISVQNSTLKSHNDSISGKVLSTVDSKISQVRNLSNPKIKKSDKTNITLDLKDSSEKESFEMTPKAVHSHTLSSPQASIKARGLDRSEKNSSKENSFRFASVASPRVYSARKSPLRSGRSSNRIDLARDTKTMISKAQIKNLGCHKKSLSLQGNISISSKIEELPMDMHSALSQYGNQLSIFEKQEISNFEEIYYVSDRYHKIQARQEKDYDDDKGDYLIIKKDHIRYRYEIVEMLGRGSFGQVLKVYDHKQKEYVALKIIRSQKKFHFQAKIEVDILQHMMNHQASNYNITDLKDSFTFRNHVCLVFELMSLSLYDMLKKNRFQGFNIIVIRKFAIQILYALKFLTYHKLIHCDLKPENILLKQSNKTGIKVIDFGSSCFESEKLYTYIQSRFYRAPEVILGLNYSSQIDMWSFGCLLYELYVGQPIFPGENEQDQLLCIMEVLGIPDKAFIAKSSRKNVFFDEEGNPKIVSNSKGKKHIPNTNSIKNMIQCEDKSFLDLIKRCLVYDPKERFTPSEALAHEWILGGLPPDLQAQHIRLVESSPERNFSMKVKDEIPTSIYTQQQRQLEHSKSIKMDTEPNYNTWKSPKSKKKLDSNDLEVSIKEVRSEEKPKKVNDLFEKNGLISDFSKRNNFNTKQTSEEDSIVNITINLNDPNKDLSIHVQQPKKIHQKRGSMAIGTHRRSDSYNLISNSICSNIKTQRSANRNLGQENQNAHREMKTKRGLSNKEIGKGGLSANINLKSGVENMSLSNNIPISNTFIGDKSKINTSVRDSATINSPYKTNSHSGCPQNNINLSDHYTENNLQKPINISTGDNYGVNIALQDLNLSNNLFDNKSVSSANAKNNKSISGGVTNIKLYKAINSPLSQSKKLQANGRGESIYSNSQTLRSNLSGCQNTGSKGEALNYLASKITSPQTEFNNTVTVSKQVNNFNTKSPQSNRTGVQNSQKLVLNEKKLNGSVQLYEKNNSPKASEILEAKARAGAKHDIGFSFSPRNISFSQPKHSVLRNK